MKKKINIDRPKIDSTEIASHQDFSSVLSRFNGLVKPPFYKTGWFITTVASIVGIAIVTTAFQVSSNSTKNDTALMTDNSPPIQEVFEDTVKNEAVFDYNEDTPCINPPNKELDMAMTTYKVDAEKGGEFTHLSGTIIKVPSLAFEDASGNLILGEVDLQFRELDNPIDFMLSGIPMDYDSSGHAMVLESDGMIEIKGFQNGVEVNIAPNKTIVVEVATTDGSSRFNSYVLNEKTKNWEFQGKPNLVQKEVVINDFTKKVTDDLYTNEEFEVITIEKEDAEYVYSIAQDAVIYFKQTEPMKPVSKGDKDRQFVLDVNTTEFPELSTYKNLVFEVIKNDPNFSASVYTQQWDDVSLSKKGKEKKYLLTLFKKGAKKTFTVFPVFSGVDLKIAMKQFDKKFNTYTQELNKRVAKESEAKTDFEVKLQKWEKAKQVVYAQEMALKNQATNYSKLLVVAKVLQVDRFGTWNVDCGIPYPKGAKTSIAFADAGGNEISVGSVNLFEKGKNTIYTYAQKEFNKFKYNPAETNVIIGFLSGERIGIVSSEQFSNLDNVKEHTFVMEIKKITPKLLENLRAEFAI